MKYEEKSFSVPVGGADYAEGWERIFGKSKKAKPKRKAAPAKEPKPEPGPNTKDVTGCDV